MYFTVAAIEDPFQDAAGFAVSRPQELSFFLAEPVHVKQFRQLRCFGERAYLEPVFEIVAHVVAAKRKHGHGIATQLSHFSSNGGSGLAAHRGSQESSV